ncbi:MAG: hypothetical protein HFE79_07855 [Ruminiclostridium sp.]|nr:hypothetical protein [Ruminiclostridium sp.]
MIIIILTGLVMIAVVVLLSDKKVNILEIIGFIVGVIGSSALLVGVNIILGYRLTDLFGVIGAVLLVAALVYGKGIKLRKR